MIDFIKNLASDAAQMTLTMFPAMGSSDIEFKNDKDIVTKVDKAVEDFIISTIKAKYPDHNIYAEESGRHLNGSEYCWIIDPIDGTTSFVHGQPFYSVSIALYQNGEPLAGVVAAPKLGEIFWAEKGKGAFMNGERIHVSSRDKLINSVLSTGFACVRAGDQINNLPRFSRVVPKIRGVRRYGSAAMDMAYVACGRLEGFWEMRLNLYDIAAGVLLVKEAGGDVCDFSGNPTFPENGTVATNGIITKELLSLM